MSSGGPYGLVRLPEYFRRYGVDKQFVCKNEIGLTSPPPINSLASSMPLFVNNQFGAAVSDKELSYHDGTDQYYPQPPRSFTAILVLLPVWPNICSWLIFTPTRPTGPSTRPPTKRARNSGTHIWKINAAWSSMVQQVFDWSLCCNSGYYGMKSALRPLHVQTSIDDMGVQMVSTLATKQRGLRVTIEVVSVNGKLEARAELPVDVAADTTSHIGALPPVVSDGNLHFVGLTLSDKDAAEIDRTVTWVQKNCKWHELLKVPPARLLLSVKSQSHDGIESTYHLVAENKSSVPAVQTCLSILWPVIVEPRYCRASGATTRRLCFPVKASTSPLPSARPCSRVGSRIPYRGGLEHPAHPDSSCGFKARWLRRTHREGGKRLPEWQRYCPRGCQKQRFRPAHNKNCYLAHGSFLEWKTGAYLPHRHSWLRHWGSTGTGGTKCFGG